jgi:hypothetical protein
MNLECNQIIDQKTRHFLHFIPDFHVVNDHLSIHQSSDQIFLFFNWLPCGNSLLLAANKSYLLDDKRIVVPVKGKHSIFAVN